LIDIDGLLVREMGMPVAQIFGMVGEIKFRELERDAVKAAHAGAPGVIVPGGGWAAQPGELQTAKMTSLVVYLECPPATAARRSQEGEVRPLLTGDPLQRMRDLLQERERFYVQAHHRVQAESSAPEAVAGQVVELARRHGGW
jgi:shikimate kinase